MAPGAHYQPPERTLPQIEDTARAYGCSHLVLVQPSVYGSDNTLLLQALGREPNRHRGVVVLDGEESDAELEAMHALGVRGVRFNLVSPVGSAVGRTESLLLERLAPRLHRLGWHVQWYVHPELLPRLAAWQARCGLRFVLDHLAGLTPAHAQDAATGTGLQQLAAAGAWIKASGWYRLQARPPYASLHPLVRELADLFAGRMVWGSDWPHTSFPPQALPAYESVRRPLTDALGEARALRVLSAGAALYA